MIYICAQPAIQYFAWQVDVMLHSFINAGINEKNIHIVSAIQNKIDPYFYRLEIKYPDVIFAYYEDTRSDKSYISSIRPHVLKKHFAKFNNLTYGEIFYHDCDIVLTKPIYIKDKEEKICYLSDTISYIGYDYIKSKGDDVLNLMLDTVGIDEATVKNNQINSGGAQYLMNGIDQYFWENVEQDCVNLYKKVTELNKVKKQENADYHELQIWCSDMWAVLWNLWKRNKVTKVIPEMDFNWATTHINKWNENYIYHNAGVTSPNDGMFFKGNYINELPDLFLKLDDDKCSYNYYQIVQQALKC